MMNDKTRIKILESHVIGIKTWIDEMKTELEDIENEMVKFFDWLQTLS